MTEAGRGAIVNIGSMAYAAPVRLHAYGPAKAGVAALTRQLAMEWGRRGIRVKCHRAGQHADATLAEHARSGERDPLWRNGLTARGHMLAPREIAAAAWFLLSDDASAVTGHVLHVDAGQSVSGFWLLSVAEQALDMREQSTRA